MSRKQLPAALSAPGSIAATLCSLACLYQTSSRCRRFRTHQHAWFYDVGSLNISHLQWSIYIGFLRSIVLPINLQHWLTVSNDLDNLHTYILQDYQPTYSFRSASPDLLATTRPRSVASRAFRHSAATTCNSMTFNIRNYDTIVTFKCRLKTFLFNQAFAI